MWVRFPPRRQRSRGLTYAHFLSIHTHPAAHIAGSGRSGTVGGDTLCGRAVEAREAHILKVAGSNPARATRFADQRKRRPNGKAAHPQPSPLVPCMMGIPGREAGGNNLTRW